ncbi:MAG TPA: DUF1015 family protein [Kiritimatiellia bacterium]|nr:DUF1015 family protein [Kiritimatiellia bacterium]
MRIKPFVTYRPHPEVALELASLPYDVGDLEDARELARANPKSFLHVERPEVDLPPDSPPGLDHQTAAANLHTFLQNHWLQPDPQPSLYLYRICLGHLTQTGIVACCHIDDYDNNLIKKHEKTKKPVEDQRTEHVLATRANTGPIFLTFRDQPDLNQRIQTATQAPHLLDFTAIDGIRHTVWKLPDPQSWVDAFQSVPAAYVADGHHRTAAAARAGQALRQANPHHTGHEEYNWFLSVLFPASHLNVIAYNRTCANLNDLSPSQFLARLTTILHLEPTTETRPTAPGTCCMYLDQTWYKLTWTPDPHADPVSALDVSVLQDRVLQPLLGVDDPRTDPRMAYAGGFDSIERMVKRVDTGRAAVAFSMFPTTVDQLIAIADANQIMPPKSTWFEPKLRSGLFVHPIDGLPSP